MACARSLGSAGRFAIAKSCAGVNTKPAHAQANPQTKMVLRSLLTMIASKSVLRSPAAGDVLAVHTQQRAG